MEFEEFRRRVRVERTTHEQRDAAEKRVPGDRLRRAIREAFARKSARELREDPEVGMEPDPLDSPHAER